MTLVAAVLAFMLFFFLPTWQLGGNFPSQLAVAAPAPSAQVGTIPGEFGTTSDSQILAGGRSDGAITPEFGPNQVFFVRGEGIENVGSGEWFIDIDNNSTIDYVFNEAGEKDYKANLNDGNAEFNRVKSLFLRGDGIDNVGSGEWFVDLNKDDAPDYIYNENGEKNYKGRLNEGDGTFGENKTFFSRGNGTDNVGSGEWLVDLNGDGAGDYIYNENGKKNYKGRINNGNGTFGENKTYFERGNGTDDVGSGEWFVDLNGDGAGDYIYNENRQSNYKGRLNKGDGTFEQNKKYFDRGSHNVGSGEWFVDLNGDDAPDYIYNESGTRKYHAHLNKGDGTFGTRILVFERGNGIDNVGYGEWFVDLDGDDVVDYIYNENGKKNYKGRLNDGNGNFGQNVVFFVQDDNENVGSGAWFVDLDGDGLADYVYNKDSSKLYKGRLRCQDYDGGNTCDYSDALKIGQIFQPMSHNSFEIQYADNLAEVLDQVKAIELDIFDSRLGIGGGVSVKGDWYVFHNPSDRPRNNCSGDLLSDCLDDIKQWHEQNPEHDLVTILIDKKQGWGTQGDQRSPQDLDALIKEVLSPDGADIFYEPSDLLEGCLQKGDPLSSMRLAAQGNCWGKVGDYKGQFMLLIGGSGPAGGITGNPNPVIAQYVRETNYNEGRIFVCPDVETVEDITGIPKSFDAKTAESVVCNNLISEILSIGIGDALRSNNYLSHIGVLAEENDCSYSTAVHRFGLSHIGIDDFFQKDWNDDRMTGGYNCAQ